MSKRRLAGRKKRATASCPASFVFRTTLGWAGVTGTAQGVNAIVLAKPSRRAAERALGRQAVQGESSLSRVVRQALRNAQTQIAAYLAGRRRTLDFPVDLSGGTSFQRKVWQAALRIPYGRARSYRWIASKVGGKQYARAVGSALGANPVLLIVPCHRVVAHDASLGGFACGLAVKRKLLELEGTLKQLKM